MQRSWPTLCHETDRVALEGFRLCDQRGLALREFELSARGAGTCSRTAVCAGQFSGA